MSTLAQKLRVNMCARVCVCVCVCVCVYWCEYMCLALRVFALFSMFYVL